LVVGVGERGGVVVVVSFLLSFFPPFFPACLPACLFRFDGRRSAVWEVVGGIVWDREDREDRRIVRR